MSGMQAPASPDSLRDGEGPRAEGAVSLREPWPGLRTGQGLRASGVLWCRDFRK